MLAVLFSLFFLFIVTSYSEKNILAQVVLLFVQLIVQGKQSRLGGSSRISKVFCLVVAVLLFYLLFISSAKEIS